MSAPELDYRLDVDDLRRPPEPGSDFSPDFDQRPDKKKLIKTVEKKKQAFFLEQCPPENEKLPEFAVFGQSNVGKSSLVNFLCNQKLLATISKRAGHTKLIQHFLIDDSWYLVDLPGIGFAEVGARNLKEMDRIVSTFIRFRKTLVRLLYLIDSSKPVDDLDVQTLRWLQEADIEFSVIFTKSDIPFKKSPFEDEFVYKPEGMSDDDPYIRRLREKARTQFAPKRRKGEPTEDDDEAVDKDVVGAATEGYFMQNPENAAMFKELGLDGPRADLANKLYRCQGSPWRIGGIPLPDMLMTSVREKEGREPVIRHILELRRLCMTRAQMSTKTLGERKRNLKKVVSGVAVKGVNPPPGIR